MKKKLKTVLLCSLYGRSGMLHYSSQLANSLMKELGSKVKVNVLLPDYSDSSLFDKKVNIIRVKAPPHVVKTALLTINPLHFRGLIKKIKDVNPDIIHFVDNHPWYLVLLKAFNDKRFFVTQHEITPHLGELIRGKMTIFVNRVLNRRADRVIVLGEKLKKDLLAQQKLDPDKILVFLMGDFTFYLKWKKKGIIEEPHTILFFGRILHYKGLDTMLKAMPLIKKDVPDIKLVIAGEGDMEPYRKLITPGISENIEIKNIYIPEPDVPAYFQRSSIIVMPYRDASSSGIVPIAYAFRKALICTDVGCLDEFIDDKKTGLLIEPENEKTLAKAVVSLLKDKAKRDTLGESGYRKMMSELSWGSIAKRLSAEYRKVVEGSD
ncbi:MAG: glycosyltransferase family 4 protein [archaeon]